MKSKIQLYHGNNKNHEFWQDESTETLMILPHGETRWIFLKLMGELMPEIPLAISPEQLITNAKTKGANLELNNAQEWQLPYKDGQMTLKCPRHRRPITVRGEPVSETIIKDRR